MLEIVNINKEYVLKDEKIDALKNINICFRRSEFVSILGHSGCGKTTLLNIIGGLDRYTSGDLIIDGVSTKQYKDADWDNYRNHRVGFVFQSYNLIPHQTVLENVELALTLSGIKRKERKARAIEVLNKVGLGDKLKAKPNQLSGGQMQRVAIARALVNDPEIILADEPTGALDSKTSKQIMELLKQVSKDRLVIMVTHNPELAEEYSTRIINLFDGELIKDNNPYTADELHSDFQKQKEKDLKEQQKPTFIKTEKKKSMSLLTAMSLSFKNLLTKKGRTLMISFAGSIGIVGIALILAVSAGMTNYINKQQSESLSSYPVSVPAITLDINNIANIMANGGLDIKQDVPEEEISVYDLKHTLMQFGSYNYITSEFTNYVKDYYNDSSKKDYLNDYLISYASDMRLVTKMHDYQLDTDYYLPINNKVSTSALNGTTSATFFEGLNNGEFVKSMYDVYGKYPTEKNEIALVLSSSAVSTLDLTRLGLASEETANGYSAIKYSDIINKKNFKLVLNDAYYDADSLDYDVIASTLALTTESYKEEPLVQAKLGEWFNDTTSNNLLDLTVTAVMVLKDGVSGSPFGTGYMYTNALTNFYRENCKNSQVVNQVKATYLSEEGGTTHLINKNTEFNLKYTVRISELEIYVSNSSLYTYNTPQAMIDALAGFEITLSDEQLIDLYLQVYGASDVPTGMYFYVATFDGKDDLTTMIDNYNSGHTDFQVHFSDSSSLLTNMLGSIVDIISYVLIAFAGISLVVSSIMIAIITYTSVIERTKEIGVLRSVGASKRDVSRVFNAETIIIGLSAGIIGVCVSALITIPLSLILKNLTGVANLAIAEFSSCLILVAISVLLTFIAGLIPAIIASKKDPVLALRSE